MTAKAKSTERRAARPAEPAARTPEQIALLDAANVVSSLEDGIAALVVIGIALHDEKTAETRALAFTTSKLMDDVAAIERAINVARGLPAGGAS